MSQRSVSLPRLTKEQRESQEAIVSKRIAQNFHKVKWSMAPKCLLEGHEGQDILYVCINQNCQESSRLVCQTCFFKSHSKHNQQFLAVDEIRTGEIEKLRYWPFESKYRPMFEFVNKHEAYVSTMIQDVNATFHGMALRVINSIDKIRLALLKKIDNFYLKQSTKRTFCERVKTELEKCFELKRIREAVRGLFTKATNHQVFQARMKTILNDEQQQRNRQLLHDYFNKAEKGTDMLFDKMHFLKKENWLIEQIEEQQSTLRQTEVTIDEAEIGIEKILPQTIAYLDRHAEGRYPLIFDKKILEDGSQYMGFEDKGVRTMFGMRKYPNTGNIYYGEWRINAKNGYGILENKKTGYRYAGSWKQDKKNGYGKEQTLTSSYEGNFVGDKKEGFGIFTKDGVRYEITWANDKMHGAGKKIQKNGDQMEVYYLNGIYSKAKSSKGTSFNLKQLTKRFGSQSGEQKAKSN